MVKIHIPIKQFAFIELELEKADEAEIKKLFKKWYNIFEKPIKEDLVEAKYVFDADEQADMEALQAIANEK